MGEYHKERKIFNIGGFRGLDTENKPDKVEPFRATSGKNFIIENESLKTRPSLVNEKIYSVDGNILGSFLFFGDEIIFTEGDYQGKCRIYISNDNETYYSDGASRNLEKRIFTNLVSFLFNGTKPFFVQEKSCLFVFCINDIYVITRVAKDENYAYVIYRIDNKIPFETTDFSDYCSEELYSELPNAYVPTIQIGDKLFEDVNLLSNKRKYQLFSEISDDEYTTYNLIGDYDPIKNGDFAKIKLSLDFYGQNIKDLKSIPVFLGVEGEMAYDYEGDDLNYWIFPNDDTTPRVVEELEETYLATDIWEYLDTDKYLVTPISSKSGLTKEKALTFVMANKQTIFEYLRDITFNETQLGIIGNRRVIFKIKLNIEHFFRVVDSTGKLISSGTKKITQKYIYFEKRELEVDSFWRLYNENYFNGYTDISLSNTFPILYAFVRVPTDKTTSETVSAVENLPETGDANTATAYYVTEEPKNIYLWSEDIQGYNQICFDYPYTIEPSLYTDDLTETQKQSVIAWFNRVNELEADILEAQVRVKTSKAITTYGNRTSNFSSEYTIDTFPYAPLPFANEPSIKRYYNFSDIYYDSNDFFDADYPYLIGFPREDFIVYVNYYQNGIGSKRFQDIGMYDALFEKIDSEISDYINVNHTLGGNYKVRLNISEINLKEHGFFGSGVKYSVYINITVTASADTTQYYYKHHILKITRSSSTSNKLYELYNQDDGLKLKISNLLINYKNEPAINLELTFSKNEYNRSLIAKSKFGTTFGSENRIFLAGNPDFQHIDRYNASNDLLGNNDKAQSYELSYFPSKNYRVVGSSSSAINGYVVATDNQLYVTKTRAVNDSCLYIRTRTLTDAGFASFYEYKTNINKTPLNNRCIVNFYNDVLMLTSEGLLAIEIASNILTNERLLKLRSGFINKELISAVKDTNVWCVEDNSYLYIVVGNNIYVADARYVAKNDQAKIENLSYEIVKWEVEPYLIFARMTDEGLVFYDLNRSYMLSDTGFDEKKVAFVSGDITFDGATVSINPSIVDELTNDSEIVIEKKADSYCRIMALSPTELVAVNEGTDKKITFTQEHIDFIELRTGFEIEELDIYAYFNADDETKVQKIDLVNLRTFILDEATTFNGIFVDWYGKKLYVTKEVGNTITLKTSRRSDVNATIIIDTESLFDKNYIYYIEKTPIEVEWKSGILDFGNKLYEKTMYSLSFYARVCETGNIFQYGYRTLRTHKDLTMLNNLPLANNLSFSESNFNIFSLTTFENNVISKLQKENNFLYIQFIFKGEGNIEISDFLVYYKNNRKNKIVS